MNLPAIATREVGPPKYAHPAFISVLHLSHLTKSAAQPAVTHEAPQELGGLGVEGSLVSGPHSSHATPDASHESSLLVCNAVFTGV